MQGNVVNNGKKELSRRLYPDRTFIFICRLLKMHLDPCEQYSLLRAYSLYVIPVFLSHCVSSPPYIRYQRSEEKGKPNKKKEMNYC